MKFIAASGGDAFPGSRERGKTVDRSPEGRKMRKNIKPFPKSEGREGGGGATLLLILTAPRKKALSRRLEKARKNQGT